MSLKLKMLCLFSIAMICMFAIGLSMSLNYRSYISKQEQLNSFYQTMLEDTQQLQMVLLQQNEAWKNLLIRGKNKQKYNLYLDRFTTFERNFQKKIKAVGEQGASFPKVTESLNKLAASHVQLGQKYRTALPVYQLADREPARTADQYLDGAFTVPEQQMANVATLVRAKKQEAFAQAELVLKQQEQWIILLGSLAGISILIAFTYILLRTVITPIKQCSGMLEQLASGEADISKRLEYKQQNELGEMATWFNQFIDNLTAITHEIDQAADLLSENTLASTQNTSEVKTLVGKQQEEILRISSSIDQLARSACEIALKANEALKSAENAQQATVATSEIMAEIDGTVTELHHSSQRNDQEMQQLQKQITGINNILEFVTEVSEQTTLLALNAAIEAARAGEHGKGFSVVASEVRHLAQRTAEATESIRLSTNQINSAATQVSNEIKYSQKQVLGIVALTEKANTHIFQMQERIEDMNHINHTIADSANHQNEVTQQIQSNICSTKNAVSHVMDSAMQSTSSNGDLAQMSVHLKQLLNSLKGGESKGQMATTAGDVELF
ncbi:methyl-accepting chemotaxis protein [Neptuniibacter sp. PT8_73]|uniref:methyl-accepting chemotaxis protein n=1 Tax=Neptuniibacter sp. PT8_73 TaxID=3398206 RepID=UPI0039F4F023